MIERIAIRDMLTFKSAALELSAGLNIFSGPSGSGKSALFTAVLALFGIKESDAAFAEAVISGAALEDFDGDEIVVRQVKKDRVRFFVNDSQVGKAVLKNSFSNLVRYLNHKEISDFNSESLLLLLDIFANGKYNGHNELIDAFSAEFEQYVRRQQELESLMEKEAKANEMIEFAKFEIEKIENTAPKEGEYEDLLNLKKLLSKKEKIGDLARAASEIYENSSPLFELYDLLGIDKTLLSDAMGDLAGAIDKAAGEVEKMEEIDPEALLDRIERLSSLIRRFGGIGEALSYCRSKKDELAQFESIEEDIKNRKKEQQQLLIELERKAAIIRENRNGAKGDLERSINGYLKMLFLPKATIDLSSADRLTAMAGQECRLKLNGVITEKISAGEFNRLRLALLASREDMQKSGEKAVLFLDEIDANVSGEEAANIAKVLKTLSRAYQIFAISHQSQLTSKADHHYLVMKIDNVSTVTLLDKEGRVQEIARIISADKITDSAIRHARELLEG
ncbi:MAG: AAA family ATPase [Helicobacteraceae bacterium]|nr:AAA family ATPase [Helicobacteraceae bacterium]